MSQKKIIAIVNPNSAHGKTQREWNDLSGGLQDALGPVTTVFTDGPNAATRLTREALRDGADGIVSVGGDGTLNEVVNGFFEDETPIRPDAVLYMLMRGTGGDFRKTLGLSTDPADAFARMKAGRTRDIDVGLMRFRDHEGRPATRYFINIASLGMGGEVDMRVNNLDWLKRFGGKTAFFLGTLFTLVLYRNKSVTFRIDDGEPQTMPVRNLAIANGRFHGGGMMVAPMAEPDDGRFEMVVLGDVGAAPLVFKSKRFYNGTHLDMRNVYHFQGRKLTAESEARVLLDVDGEAPGRLPLTLELVPGAVKLCC